MKLTFEKVKNFDNIYFVVRNKKDVCSLGTIEFFKDWRCWVWYQDKDVIMSSECLQQVVDKLKELDKNV
jgi:hypothetical protein